LSLNKNDPRNKKTKKVENIKALLNIKSRPKKETSKFEEKTAARIYTIGTNTIDSVRRLSGNSKVLSFNFIIAQINSMTNNGARKVIALSEVKETTRDDQNIIGNTKTVRINSQLGTELPKDFLGSFMSSICIFSMFF